MKFPLLIVALFMFTFCALAQTSVTSLPGATGEVPAVQLQKLLVAAIVPLVVAGVKVGVPRIPKPLLPPLAMALGALADYIGSLVGAWHGNLIVGIVLGAAGVGVREAVTQVTKSPTELPPANSIQ